MSDVILFSALAAAGVLIACIALALPRRVHEADELNNLVATPLASGRQRSVSASPSRSKRWRTGRPAPSPQWWADIGGAPDTSNLKWRPSEFVMIQVAFLIGGPSFLCFVSASGPVRDFGRGAYLLPMRYVRYRQARRLKALSRQLPDTLSLLSNGSGGAFLPQAMETVASNTSHRLPMRLAVHQGDEHRQCNRARADEHVRRTGSEDST